MNENTIKDIESKILKKLKNKKYFVKFITILGYVHIELEKNIDFYNTCFGDISDTIENILKKLIKKNIIEIKDKKYFESSSFKLNSYEDLWNKFLKNEKLL